MVGELTPESGTEPRPQKRRWRRMILLGAAVVLGIAFLSQTPVASTILARALVRAFAPAGLEVEIGRVGWFPLTSLDVGGLEVRDVRGQRILTADQVAVDHRLLALLAGRISIGAVRVEGASLTLRDRPGGSWGLGLPSDSTPGAEPSTGRPVHVSSIRIVGARVEVVSPGAGDGGRWSDTTLVLSDIEGTMNELRVLSDASVFGGVGPFRALGRTGLAPDDYSMWLNTSGELNGRALQLDEVAVRGVQSEVVGELAFQWTAGPSGDAATIEAGFSSDALAPEDIQAFSPAWAGQSALSFDARIAGPVDSLPIALEARAVPPQTGAIAGTLTLASRAPQPTIDWNLAFEQFDPRVALGPDGPPGDLTGSTHATMEGSDPARWSGPFVIQLEPSALGEFMLASSRVELDFADGLGVGEIQVDAATGGATTKLNGVLSVRPFDSVPWFQTAGTVAYATPAGPGTRPGGVAVDAWIELEGTGSASAELTLQAELTARRGQAVRLGGTAFTPVTARATLDRGAGAWTVDAASGETALVGRGTLALSENATTIAASNLAWDNLDVASLLRDSVPSSVSGSLRGGVTLAPGATPDSHGTVSMHGLHYGDAALDSVRGSWSLRAGALASDWALALDSGTVRGRLVGRPFADVPTYSVLDGRLSDFDVGTLLPPVDSSARRAPVHTSLNALFNGQWSGSRPQLANGRLEWELLPSVVQRADSLAGDGTLRLDDGRVAVDGRLGSRRAAASWTAEVRPFASTPSWRVDSARLDEVPLHEWLGLDLPAPVDLTARIEGAGTGFTVDDARGWMTIQLDGSRVGAREVRSAEGRIDMDAGTFDLSASATTDSVWVAGTGTVGMAGDTLRYDVDFRADYGQSDATVSRRESPSVRGSIEGVGSTADDIRALVSLDIDSLYVGAFALDSARVRGGLADGLLRVDSLSARGPSLVADAQGVVGLAAGTSSDLTANLTLSSFGPFRPLVQVQPLSIGEGRARLTFTGPYSDMLATASVEANAILLGDLQLRGLTANGELAANGTRLQAGRGKINLSGLGGPVVSVGNTDLNIEWAGEDIALDLQSEVDERRTLQVTSRLDPRPEARTVRIESLGASVDEDVWTLTEPVTVHFGESLEISPAEIVASDQRLFVEGSLSPRGPQALSLALENFRVGTVADLLGFPALSGTFGFTLDLAGTTSAPRIETRYRATLRSQAVPEPAVLSGVLDYDSSRIRLDTELGGPAGGAVEIAGTLPAALTLPWSAGAVPPLLASADGPVDLALTADSISLGWLHAFLDPLGLEDVGGVVQARLQIDGTAENPVMAGQASLHRGRLDPVALGTSWRDITGALTFDGSSVHLDSLRIVSSDGPLTATGTVALERLDVGQFDVEFQAERFRVVDNDLAQAVASGEGRIEGTTARPEISADLRLLSTDVHLDALEVSQDARDVQLTEEDYQQLQATFGRDYRDRERQPLALMDSLTVEVNVSMGRDTWVRQTSNPRMALQMSGDVRIEKAPRDSLRFFGTVEAIPERSYIEQFGRRFRIAQGQVDLRGRPSETQVDILAEYAIPSSRNPDQAEVTINLGVEGTPTQVNVTLSSEPTMDNSDIVSYLATGRPASQDVGVAGSGGTLTGVGADLAVGAVANALEGAAAEQIGLDVIDIQTDGLEGARLVAGRYVSPSLFVGFEQPLTRGSSSDGIVGSQNSGSRVQLEYQAIRWLLLNLELGGGGFDFLLRSRYAY